MLNVVLQVTHQHQVTCLVPAGMEGMVVDVAEDSAGTDTVGPIFGIYELAETVHDHSTVLPFALLLVLLRLHSTQTFSTSNSVRTSSCSVKEKTCPDTYYILFKELHYQNKLLSY